MRASQNSSPMVLALAVLAQVLLAGCGPESGGADSAAHAGHTPVALEAEGDVRVRRNVKALSDKERKEFVKAVLKLKKVPSPYDGSISYYDQLVVWHRSLYPCNPGTMHHGMAMGHGGPLFLPWHRQYLMLFENALREVSGNKDLTVPYWDWTDPESTAAVFQEDFMGGDGDPSDGYAVTSGPFRKGRWPVTIQPEGWAEQPSAFPHLVRRFGSIPSAATLPVPAEVEEALAAPLYDVAPFDTTSDSSLSFRNALEGYRDGTGQNSMVCMPDGYMFPLPLNPPKLHNAVHAWVGGLLDLLPDGRPVFGTMVTSTSPNDPIFFLHHSNIDRIWAEWQSRHGTYTYQPVSGFPGNHVDDHLMPFHHFGMMVTPGDLEDSAALGYRYE